MTSWLSSMLTSSWSRVKPATAKRNAQPLRLFPSRGNAFDIVGRIAVGGLADAIEHTLDLVEAKQKRT